MTSNPFERLVVASRPPKPRERGLTMIADWGMPLGQQAEVLSVSAPYIDLAKIAVGIAALLPTDTLKDKMLFGAASGSKSPMQSALDVLSDRELEVFEMTGRGLPTREIAERMHLSVKTVESYRARIKTKLNLESGTELMQHAVRWVEGEGAG